MKLDSNVKIAKLSASTIDGGQNRGQFAYIRRDFSVLILENIGSNADSTYLGLVM